MEDWIVITQDASGYYIVEEPAENRSDAVLKGARWTRNTIVGAFPRLWAEGCGWRQTAPRPEFDVKTKEMLDAWGRGETTPDWPDKVARASVAQANKQPPRDRWWDLPAPNAPGFADQCWAAVEAIGKGT